jgi:hypothetical protein
MNNNGIGIKVTDVRLLQELKSTLLGFWPNRKNNYFPGALPVSIERKNFDTLIKYPYVISLKSDGTRYFMMAYNESVYLVDRVFNFYKVNQNFKKNIYGSSTEGCGMILDGEMMPSGSSGPNGSNDRSIFYVHDCVCMFSRDITKEFFDDRYDSIKLALSLWSPEGSDFDLAIKKFYKYNEFDMNVINNADHKIDGLIFTPIEEEIGTGRQYNLFKWKYKHTFDFLITIEGPDYVAYVFDKQGLKKYATVKRKNATFSKLLAKNCPKFKSGDIVECICNVKEESFEPILLRSDKESPNALDTVKKTLLNIKENITIEELLVLINIPELSRNSL